MLFEVGYVGVFVGFNCFKREACYELVAGIEYA
jgi:hypothetical protein